MHRIAYVAVERANIHFDKWYSYLIPQHLHVATHVGSMVLVPFGKGTHARMGIVLQLEQTDDLSARLKQIYDVAPESAILSKELLAIVERLREKTFCTYYEAVKTVIPYGAQYRAVKTQTGYELKKQGTRDLEIVYEICETLQNLRLTAKQEKVLALLQQGEKTAQELELQGASKAVIKTLLTKGCIRKKQRDKQFLSMISKQDLPEIQLSHVQTTAYQELEKLLLSAPAASLLYGVTSSGKTLVFLKLIEKTLSLGKQALILVPEIALTSQMITRLQYHFGTQVAVQHSALSHTERLLTWKKIQSGAVSIVIGTRSAVFAPLEKIGLIVIDEEQESAYHSENAPRYFAHDIAKYRAVTHKALLLFASATPSIESYFYAKQGRYHFSSLQERYNQMPLPAVYFADMKQELQRGNMGGISEFLEREIQKNLAQKEQTVLLLNRRGYQTVGMCTACSQVVQCPACSVPMVYHKQENKLMCHYCGFVLQPAPMQCPSCQERIKYTGFGTQRVEEELSEKFPSARILRMDLDTTRKKNAHEEMLAAFGQGKYDILLGTQMVAKGLDFERVTLVGVLGIDQMLFAQGYHAQEAAFSLITQVIGRAGRAQYPGRAVIQTADPEHPVLQMAAQQDYPQFYEREIAFRKLNLYPPFCDICLIGFCGEKEERVFAAACQMARIIQSKAQSMKQVPLRLLGPAPMNILMVKKKYRYHLILKCRENQLFRALIRSALEAYDEQGLSAHAQILIDFDADSDF